MDLDEQEYRRKYLKYKLKYKNLKKQQQIGGILSSPDKQLTEYFKQIHENGKNYNLSYYLRYFDPLTNIPLETASKELAKLPQKLIVDLRNAEKIKQHNMDIINTIKNIIETKDLKKIQIILENFIPQLDILLDYTYNIERLERIKSGIQVIKTDMERIKTTIEAIEAKVEISKTINLYNIFGNYIDIIKSEYIITRDIISQYFTILLQKTMFGTYKIIDHINDFNKRASEYERTKVLTEISTVEKYMNNYKKFLQKPTTENISKRLYLKQIDEIIEVTNIINKNIKR